MLTTNIPHPTWTTTILSEEGWAGEKRWGDEGRSSASIANLSSQGQVRFNYFPSGGRLVHQALCGDVL